MQSAFRSEAVLSGIILLAVPLLLRMWARMEAKYHDTLECRNVVQTYLIAAGGSVCSLLATWAGNPQTALVLQVSANLWLRPVPVSGLLAGCNGAQLSSVDIITTSSRHEYAAR